MSQSEKKRVAFSFVWKLLERGSAQLITLIVQIVLARILAPDEFGVISILLVFINIANVFIQKGFASSLIRKEDVSNKDYNTAFVVSEAIAIFCVVILIVFSNTIESFYSIPNLGTYMRVLSVSLLFGALYSVQNAELVKKMHFKQIFYRSIASSIGSGVIGIVAAFLGMGVWALIMQSVAQQVIICFATMVACEWKPRIEFSRKSFDELFFFGSKILVAEIISIGVENVRTLIIGKKYAATDLAYYDRGQVYPATAMRSIYDTISSVLLPVFSKIQNKPQKLADTVVQSLSISSFLICPLFIGLAAVARPFILLILTSKWESAAPFLIIFCIYQIAFPAYGILRQCLYALGKSDDVLRFEILRSIFFIIAIIVGLIFNTIAIAVFSCIAMYLTTIMYYCGVRKYLPLKTKKMILSIIKTIFQCVVMTMLIILFNKMQISIMLQILIDVVLGMVTYILLSVVLKNESFLFCVSFFKNR